MPVEQKEIDANKWHSINESNVIYDATLEWRLLAASTEDSDERSQISRHKAKHWKNASTENFKTLNTSKLLIVRTYLQSFRYFERPLERREVLRQFEFPDQLRKSTEKLIVKIQSAAKLRYASPTFGFWQNSTLTFQLNQSATLTMKRPLNGSDEIIYVAVHMRLGDYHENINNIIAGPEYFLTAAAHFLSQYKYVC